MNYKILRKVQDPLGIKALKKKFAGVLLSISGSEVCFLKLPLFIQSSDMFLFLRVMGSVWTMFRGSGSWFTCLD